MHCHQGLGLFLICFFPSVPVNSKYLCQRQQGCWSQVFSDAICVFTKAPFPEHSRPTAAKLLSPVRPAPRQAGGYDLLSFSSVLRALGSLFLTSRCFFAYLSLETSREKQTPHRDVSAEAFLYRYLLYLGAGGARCPV